MMIPSACPVREMPEEIRNEIRGLFRNLLLCGAVESKIGFEGSEESLENLYDVGYIKFSMEPAEGVGRTRLLMYDKRIGGYLIVTRLSLELENGGQT